MACRSKYDVIIVDPLFPKPDTTPVQDGNPQYPYRKPKNRVPRLLPMVRRPVWTLFQARSNQQQRVDEKRIESLGWIRSTSYADNGSYHICHLCPSIHVRSRYCKHCDRRHHERWNACQGLYEMARASGNCEDMDRLPDLLEIPIEDEKARDDYSRLDGLRHECSRNGQKRSVQTTDG